MTAKVPTVFVPPAVQKPTGVTLDQETLQLTVGSTAQLTATVTPHEAVNQDVVWSSNHEQVAIVDEEGKVTAVGEGKARITVTTVDGGLIAISEVTVEEEEAPTPTVDFNHLIQLTESYVTNKEVADSLIRKLQAAKKSAAKGQQKAVNGQLRAYENQLNGQTGKSISKEDAQRLISLANQLK